MAWRDILGQLPERDGPMDTEQRQHLASLRQLHQRRLQALELRAAVHGGATPPEVSIEIETRFELVFGPEMKTDL